MSGINTQLKTFLEFLDVHKNYSAHTLRAYRNDLCEFIRVFAEYKGKNPDKKEDLESLTASHVDVLSIRSYLGALYKKRDKKSSVARKLSAVRSFFNHLLKNGSVQENPADMVATPKQEKPIPAYLTVDDMFRLLDNIETNTVAGLRDKAMFETLYSTGIRISELSGLDLAQVDSSGGVIRVVGKGNKERVVPIGKRALKAIEEYRMALAELGQDWLKDRAALFLNKDGKRLTERSMARLLKFWADKAEISVPIFPHAVRHTFATHMLDAGADLRGVQEILGHESLSTTQKYTHVTIDRLSRAYDKAHPRK
ncbi:MAG: tyrosine recombinase XerC [Desulfobacteraceae bacterium]|jgi:integrase/recombinase XerC